MWMIWLGVLLALGTLITETASTLLDCVFTSRPVVRTEAEKALRAWEGRVENAIRGIAYGNEQYWERPLVNESIKKPGHNQRVINAVGARYSLGELGKMGLISGDGAGMPEAISNKNQAQEAALTRLRQAEAKVSEETRRNQQRWMNQQ